MLAKYNTGPNSTRVNIYAKPRAIAVAIQNNDISEISYCVENIILLPTCIDLRKKISHRKANESFWLKFITLEGFFTNMLSDLTTV